MNVRGNFLLIVLLGSTACWAQAGNDGAISRDDAKKLKNPVAYTKKSLTQGHTLFVRTCSTCHGQDGKAQVDVIADATDLTSPNMYKSGTSDGEIYRSLRDGAGQNQTMPSFKNAFAKEDDLWHLVNYIRSLWPDGMRPELQPDDSKDSKDNKKK
jgi:mono/diheme cytochrome c family protein